MAEITGNNPLYPEVKRKLPVAEEIAKVRSSLEKKVFGEGLPVGQWKRACKDELENNPRAQPFEEVFDAVVDKAVVINTELDTFWRQKHGGLVSEAGTSPSVSQANPQVVKEMFKSVFGNFPQGEIEIFKGPITLRFVVDDEDFRVLQNARGGTEEVLAGFLMQRVPGRNFSAIVMKRQLEYYNLSVVVHHELEHAKNFLLMLGKIDALSNSFQMPQKDHERSGRMLTSDSNAEANAKDEMLACFSIVASMTPDRTPFDQLIEFVHKHGEAVVSVLTEPSYIEKAFHPSREEKVQYQRNVPAGSAGLIELLEVYFQDGMGFGESARMAMNVLEQFSLKDWPAVTRLIKFRHGQKAT